MKELSATVTQRGQVTLPAEVRRLLGIEAHDKVVFVIEDGEVKLDRPKFTFLSVAGSVPALGHPVDADQQIRDAKAEKAAREWGERQKG